MSDPYADIADEEQDPYTGIAAPEQNAAAAPVSTAAAPTAAPITFADWLHNNAAYTGTQLARAGAQAITALPNMAADMGVASRNVLGDAYNRMAGNAATPDYELPSVTFRHLLDSYLPPPTTTAQKLSELGSTVLLGAGAGAAGVPGMTAPTYGNVPASFISSAARNGLTVAQQRAAEAGEDLGMRTTPGQATGSVPLQQFEAKLQSSPWASGPFARLARGNQQALNEAWAGTSGGIGQGGASVDSTVLQNALDRTGDVFNAARNANSIVMQEPGATSRVLDAVDNDYEGLIPGSVRDNPLVARLEALTGRGAINGEQLGQLSSKLGQAANNQMTSASGDRQIGQALFDVKNHADDLLQSTLSGDDAAEYASARAQYRAAMQLAARPGNVNPNTGNVNGSALASYLQAKDKAGFLFGRNQSDAYNATRFAQAFRPIVGDSGTATRSWNWKELPLALPANAFSRLYLSAPGSAVMRGLANAPGALSSGPPHSVLSGLQVGLPTAVPYLTE